MAQVWILNRSVDPVTAIKDGADFGICGDCVHRKQADGSRSCYVNVGQAPLSIFKAYKAGRYVHDPMCLESRKAVKGRKIRFGAYGDPSIIRPIIVKTLMKHASGHTGYTHQWRQEWAQDFKGIFQASCDGFADYLDATSHGWKTFSVVPKGYMPNKIKLCPATVTNSNAQCVTCSLCDGAKADIYVEAHGSGGKYVLNVA